VDFLVKSSIALWCHNDELTILYVVEKAFQDSHSRKRMVDRGGKFMQQLDSIPMK
jgi:hypothetical protein